MSKGLVFRVHAIKRMAERGIDPGEVRDVVERGEVIERYPGDHPYPSRLPLGFSGTRPLHVVVADNEKDNETIVVTVHVPDPQQWDSEFKRRKKS